MSLPVVCFCTYLSGPGSTWRPRDHDALKFVKAIKGRTLNLYADVPVCGHLKRLDNSNRVQATVWFAEMAADYLSASNMSGPFTLIPVPSSTVTVGVDGQYPALIMSRDLAARLNDGTAVLDCLRWRTSLRSAHSGGTRDPRALYRNLQPPARITRECDPVILVDDVLTTGGHLMACASVVRRSLDRPRLALVAGRTDWVQQADAFGIREEQIDDFEP